ncbi:hypothetical protein SBC2_77110 (plasmid) [Caballeronia sp. SBC2]|nr:hypothetical protein SBC2_77110 [Caballeronia sp. SBC2]
MAHAKIVTTDADGSEVDLCISGDLAGFDSRSDAIAFGKNWAQQWVSQWFCRLEMIGQGVTICYNEPPCTELR